MQGPACARGTHLAPPAFTRQPSTAQIFLEANVAATHIAASRALARRVRGCKLVGANHAQRCCSEMGHVAQPRRTPPAPFAVFLHRHGVRVLGWASPGDSFLMHLCSRGQAASPRNHPAELCQPRGAPHFPKPQGSRTGAWLLLQTFPNVHCHIRCPR